MINRFNIRVYMLLFNDENQVLVSDEVIKTGHYTKFPGGGLEFGEGPVDAIKREAIEELGQDIEVLELVHVTEFFQQSRFHEGDQVVCIYYSVRLLDDVKFRVASKAMDFQSGNEGEESFRWFPWADVLVDELSFPTDKAAVCSLLNENSHAG